METDRFSRAPQRISWCAWSRSGRRGRAADWRLVLWGVRAEEMMVKMQDGACETHPAFEFLLPLSVLPYLGKMTIWYGCGMRPDARPPPPPPSPASGGAPSPTSRAIPWGLHRPPALPPMPGPAGGDHVGGDRDNARTPPRFLPARQTPSPAGSAIPAKPRRRLFPK
ncbi:hypothetical protein K525DRAFT_283398 [Schizophyllum commune Loenen D]|nr:hypothetical protein K525DRAFT_283398 [Schizophyllum commune Loenen D]